MGGAVRRPVTAKREVVLKQFLSRAPRARGHGFRENTCLGVLQTPRETSVRNLMRDKGLVVIRGGGDLATGVIARLYRAGYRVLVLELAHPLVVRRRVAVATAIAEGEILIEDLIARRAETLAEALSLTHQGVIPVLISPALPFIADDLVALVDARMAKRNLDTHLAQAPLVIALGPGFVAGQDCHAVIETMRGHDLGRVLWRGAALPNTGTPGIVAGKGAERVLRAPVAGIVTWQVDIGVVVAEGQPLGQVAGTPLVAPFAGVVRGLIASGTTVSAGLKIGDVDARCEVAACFTISEKAFAVGGGVLEAVLMRAPAAAPHPLPVLSLPGAMGVRGRKELIALVGGGGKTSLMFALAQALGPGAITSTTTRIFAAQMRHAPVALSPTEITHLTTALRRWGTALIVGETVGDKVSGVDPAYLAGLWQRPDVRHVIVEADGSRMRPCKAPAHHEPLIPTEATVVMPVVGLDALGQSVFAAAHRPELVCALTGLQENEAITEAALVMLLTHEQGGLKGIPAEARVIPFLNKVESPASLAAARRIAAQVLRHKRIERVIIGAVQTSQAVQELHRPITAVILAAGQASRMGQLKQLLPWGETTILGQTLRQVAQSLVQEILVVTGHEAEAVGNEVRQVELAGGEMRPRLLHNPYYLQGEMLSSLQQAIRHLDSRTAAVLVVLADQPLVEPETYNEILLAYAQGYAGLIVPEYAGQRGNPVLIDRRYFGELLALPPGAAPRHLLQQHPHDLYAVPVSRESVIQDLDTPEVYERWRPGE